MPPTKKQAQQMADLAEHQAAIGAPNAAAMRLLAQWTAEDATDDETEDDDS